MRHTGTQRLETARLILRRFRVEDAEAAFRNWTGDPEVTAYLTWRTHADVRITRRVIEDWIGAYPQPDFYQWAIEPKDVGEPVGSISVVRLNEDIGECELGWCLGRAWWGRGVMPEAARAVTGFLFRQVGANRVAARHAVGNEKSGRVMQKLGMTREGLLRQASRSNQGLEDVVLYAVLAGEFRMNAE